MEGDHCLLMDQVYLIIITKVMCRRNTTFSLSIKRLITTHTCNNITPILWDCANSQSHIYHTYWHIILQHLIEIWSSSLNYAMHFNIFSTEFDSCFIFLVADPCLLPDRSSSPCSEFMLISCPFLRPPISSPGPSPTGVVPWAPPPHPHPGEPADRRWKELEFQFSCDMDTPGNPGGWCGTRRLPVYPHSWVSDLALVEHISHLFGVF